MRGEYRESGGGVLELVDWSMIRGEGTPALREAEGAGRFMPDVRWLGDLDCQLSPK